MYDEVQLKTIMDKIHETLLDYGVDWKLDDNKYYSFMLSEMKIKIKKILMW